MYAWWNRIGACVVALLAACDLTDPLPTRPEGPHVTKVTPSRAFAGQKVQVAGSGFDHPANQNLVWFGAVAAQAESILASGDLLVKVPDDARSGPVVVENARGRSAPASQLDFLGAGHLRRGQLASRQPVLHLAIDVVARGDEVFLLSEALGGLVSSRGTTLQPPTGATLRGVLAFGTTGPVAVLGEEAIYLANLAMGTVTKTALDLGEGTSIVLANFATPTRAWICVLQPDGATKVVALDEKDGALALGETVDVELEEVFSLDTNPLSSRIVLGGRMSGGGYGLQVVRDGASRLFPLPDGGILSTQTTVGDLTYVVVADGSLVVLDHSQEPAQWRGGLAAPVSGRSPYVVQPVQVGDTALVLATFLGFDRFVAIDLQGRVAWSVPVGSPGAFMVDRANARAYVVDEATNDVDVIDLATGRSLNRIPFDFGLGDDGGAWQAMAWDPAGDRLLAVAQRSGALLPFSGDSLRPDTAIALARRTPGGAPVSLARGVLSSSRDGTIWIAHEFELGRIALGSAVEEIVVTDLPARGKYLAEASDGSIVVGMLDHVGLWRAGAGGTGTFVAQPVGGLIAEVTVGPGDRVATSWSPVGTPSGIGSVTTWTLDELARGAPPSRSWAPTDTWSQHVGMVWVNARPVVFLASTPPNPAGAAIWLDENFSLAAAGKSPFLSWGPIVVSPDGTRVAWGEMRGRGTVVNVASLSGHDFVREHSVVMEGGVRSMVFDPGGARLFVMLIGPESIAVVE